MKYFFIKEYNPAYDFFVLRYFKSKGLDVDENLTYEQASSIASMLQKKGETGADEHGPRQYFAFKKNLAPHESLFWDYRRGWSYHPEVRESDEWYFYEATGIKRADIDRMAKLERELPEGRGKLLFTREDVAADFSDFYVRFLRNPLRRDMKQGKIGTELFKYLSDGERESLPDSRVVGREKFEAETHRIAGEAQKWLDEITPEKISGDIDRVLQEHWKNTDHIKQGHSMSDPGKKSWHCQHKSEYVELIYFRDEGVEGQLPTLQPARGFRIWVKHPWEEGWESVLFPMYGVAPAS